MFHLGPVLSCRFLGMFLSIGLVAGGCSAGLDARDSYVTGASLMPVSGPETGTVAGRRRSPFISAHRGGSAYAPEDTLTAHKNAQRLQVDDFETDTQFTSNGVLVIIHDATLDRTTNCTGNVKDHTFAEVRACDAGYWWAPNQATTVDDPTAAHPYRGKGVVIPTARELFDYAATLGTATSGPTVTIEIKNIPGEANYEPRCPTAAAALVGLIHQSGIQPRITVQAFDPTCIDSVKALDKTVKTLYLTVAAPGKAAPNVAYCKAMGHDFASPSYLSPDFGAAMVATAHRAGVRVNPYTVDTIAGMQAVTADGVDGFITNFPACAEQRIGETPPAVLTAPEAGGGVSTPLCRNGTGSP